MNSQLPKHQLTKSKILYTNSSVTYLPIDTQRVNHVVPTDFLNKIIHGDCQTVLAQLPSQCIDLIITSPPYAEKRKTSYGGIKADEYVGWFIPITQELKRVLKPTGSFVLNIKEPAIDGERHTFVIELILELRRQGWFWVEEYCWHKKNCFPGKWPNRFRDSWERCLHFTLNKKFAMYQEAVMVPSGKWQDKRLKNLGKSDAQRNKSTTASGLSRKVANWLTRDMAYPTNVLHLATECTNRGHSAAFPIDLASWFIKLFTQPNDVVLDPFIGSGTTAIACQDLNRNFIGVEIDKKYCELSYQALELGINQNIQENLDKQNIC